VEPVISQGDVSTIMDVLAYIRDDVEAIRKSLEDDDGEENHEADA
jgi:hypothetical protein